MMALPELDRNGATCLDEYGKWNSVFRRYRRWVSTGVFDARATGRPSSVNERMDLAREALGNVPCRDHDPPLPVAPCWWTRTQVESIMTISPSKAAETAESRRSHTPPLRQRTNRL
jgi:hypothetical protein